MQRLFVVIPSLLPGAVVGSCGLPLPLRSQAKETAHTMRFQGCQSALLSATSAKWPEKGNGAAYRLAHLKNVLSRLRFENQHPKPRSPIVACL